MAIIISDKVRNKYFKKMKCVVCGNKFWKPNKPRKGRRTRGLRPYNAITCSHKCSVKYCH